MKHTIIISLVSILLVGTQCKPINTISRVSPDTSTELSGKWNDTDARMVSEEMITDALSTNWLANHRESEAKPPVVIVGTVRNESMEHIDTDIITKEMERAFVNSGQVTLVANASERIEIRDERIDQQSNASLESMKAMAKELGADYMLIGNISSIMDDAPDGRTTAVFYTVNLELISIESNVKVWIGNKKIKKVIERRNYRG
jgi:uncharacterized protein (TIGR02722 family)